MLISHFIIALIVAVLVVPKTTQSLEEINRHVVKEYKKEPTYVVDIDGGSFVIASNNYRQISSRWIDELELLKPSELPDSEPIVGELIFKVHIKERRKELLYSRFFLSSAIELSPLGK